MKVQIYSCIPEVPFELVTLRFSQILTLIFTLSAFSQNVYSEHL